MTSTRKSTTLLVEADQNLRINWQLGRFKLVVASFSCAELGTDQPHSKVRGSITIAHD